MSETETESQWVTSIKTIFQQKSTISGTVENHILVNGYYWFFIDSDMAKELLDDLNVTPFVDHDNKCVVFVDRATL